MLICDDILNKTLLPGYLLDEWNKNLKLVTIIIHTHKETHWLLPSNIKMESDNPKKFKMALQNFLYENSFYSLDEYFSLSERKR